jgi:hypothetical protein
MYENETMRPIVTILRREAGGIKEKDGEDQSNYNIL